MRALPLLGLLLTLAACAEPPPSAFYKAQGKAEGTAIGNNATGEPCTLVGLEGGGADIFCGAWQQPSARIRTGASAGGGSLQQLATASPWRVELESRFACGDPKPEGAGSLILQCTRRAGGWAQLALVTERGGKAWLADGTPASYPAIQRAIAQLSGTAPAAAAAAAAPISSDMASYLASRSFSAGDIAAYESLMSAGLQANLAGRPEQAEKAYRAALGLQEKSQGKDSPASAAPLMSLALQISEQGRYGEAQVLFDRAGRLLDTPGAAQVDRNGRARLALYLGLHALDQGDAKAAIARFREAEALYRVQVPDAREKPLAVPRHFAMNGIGGLSVSDALANARPYATLAEKEALLGILEARRDRAVALRLMGETAQASQEGAAAEEFARANNLAAPLYTARLYRTVGINAAATDRLPQAVGDLDQSLRAFRLSMPRTHPIAETELAQAELFDKQGDNARALATCRSAAQLLRDTKDGVDFDRMQPCLAIYAKAAKAAKDDQPLLHEMFASAQLTRGSVTDQEIRQTAVRLAAGGADPKVSEAIRKQQDAEKALTDLLRERDAIGEKPADSAAADRARQLDGDIAKARAALADADATVQAAAPNYQQLIQQAVKPEDVFAALHPGEAFVAITLSRNGGWTFVLRGGRISVAPVPGGTERVAALVARFRDSIVPGPTATQVPQFDTKAAQELYDLTLGTLAHALAGATELTIAPTGPLLSVPFEALLTGPANPLDLSNAPFLVRRYVIAHVPAAANFVKLRQTQASKAQHAWFGFGDFRPITQAQALRTYPGAGCRESALELAGLPALPGTQLELGIASQIFGARPGDQLTGAAFTVPAIEALNKKGTLADYRILHFATHGLLPAELACQDQPAIVTSAPEGATDAKGALLNTSEISDLKVDADAIVLSACNTGGAGGSTAGESLAGLARAFFYAGARSLIVTHWEVNDAAATKLISQTLFDYETDRADGLANALQKAQLKFLDAKDIDAALKHPYYWAPFALVGEGGARARSAQITASPSRTAGL